MTKKKKVKFRLKSSLRHLISQDCEVGSVFQNLFDVHTSTHSGCDAKNDNLSRKITIPAHLDFLHRSKDEIQIYWRRSEICNLGLASNHIRNFQIFWSFPILLFWFIHCFLPHHKACKLDRTGKHLAFHAKTSYFSLAKKYRNIEI